MLTLPTIHVKFVKWTAGVETEYILSDSFYVFTHKALPILGKAFRLWCVAVYLYLISFFPLLMMMPL